jgi:hypothetical protein
VAGPRDRRISYWLSADGPKAPARKRALGLLITLTTNKNES